jgi:phosphomannomutase
MTKIKFGTDGWRAIIASEFTTENIARVAEGTAQWLLNNHHEKPAVVLGHDCRFGGELFSETVANVLTHYGIKVFLARGFVSTPMISLATVKYKANLGIIITASHNPAAYSGFKLKGSYGGPLLPEKIEEIEKLIPEKCVVDKGAFSIKNPLVKIVDIELLYCRLIEKNFDLKAIKRSKMNLAYDAMYGSGQHVLMRLMPEIILLHCNHNPSFNGTAPEPIAKNLREISTLIKNMNRGKRVQKIASALATDGDADRLGLLDSKGDFVDSHHIILLLIHYLCKYKKMKGKVVVAFSVTPRVKKICAHYGLELQVVKIGFKYICGIMIEEDVLLGGEESGGIAIKGHIPERDGIWIGLTLWEFMAKSGKTLYELIQEVYKITGSFAFERDDLHLSESIKNKIVENCTNKKYTSFGKYKIEQLDDLDGWKYFFNKTEWLMIRASGTEPVLRLYAESSSQKKAFDILKAAKKTLLSI